MEISFQDKIIEKHNEKLKINNDSVFYTKTPIFLDFSY